MKLARIESAIQAVREADDEAERLRRIESAWGLVTRAAFGRRMPGTLEEATKLLGIEVGERDEVSASRARAVERLARGQSKSGKPVYLVRNGQPVGPPLVDEPLGDPEL